MNEIIKKISEIIVPILSKKEGNLYFLGLVQRTDFENKWDILIIADWIKENNNHSDLKYVIEELNKVFNEDLYFLEDVVLYKADDHFVQDLTRAIAKNAVFLNENNKLMLWDDGFINVIPLCQKLDSLITKIDNVRTDVLISDF